MRKSVYFYNVKFSCEVISSSIKKLESFLNEKEPKTSNEFIVKIGKETWQHDNESEFFADYSQNITFARYMKSYSYGKYGLTIEFREANTKIAVQSPERHQIESIHQIFIQNEKKCLLPPDQQGMKSPIIFLGHGQSNQWRDLKDHLQDKHGYKIEAYEVGARAGHTVRDILEEMLTKSSFALLVMTAEDRDADGVMHARENVIHELGLFQGKLGFSRAIVLLEEGTNEFSNTQGIQQIRYSKNNIKETFGEVIATIKREFENKDAEED